jgi:hypothetical protein
MPGKEDRLPTSRPRRWPAALFVMFLAVAGLAAIARFEARPPRGAEEVAAIFPPWMDRERALALVASTGGLVVRQGALDTVFVVHGNDPGLIDRLYAVGAWAVVDPVAFGGCLVRRPGKPA